MDHVDRTDNTLASIGTCSYGWQMDDASEAITGTLAGYGFSVGSSGYDTEDRLVNWQRSDSALSQLWNLSLVGDWNSITENSTVQTRTHGDAHELLTAGGSAVSHDTKGNQTLIPATLASSALALNWDFENKLSTADVGNDSSVDVTYKFDALGRRVGRDDGTNDVVYFQDGQQTLADYPAGTAAGSPTYTYIYASYIDEPVLRTDSSGGKFYYHRNQQYSIVALTDGVGAIQERYAYSAYGEPVFMNGSGTVLAGPTNRYTYTGREWDEKLELYHYRARMYDPSAGRFVSRDPIGYEAGPRTYAYSAMLRDPLGLSPVAAIQADDGTVSCSDFIGTLNNDTPNRRWPSIAKTQYKRGAHIFCGSCNFQGGETWPDGSQCHVCLHSDIRLGPGQWEALLIHELIHCSQFKCGRAGVGPWIGDPIDPPDWEPRQGGPDPADCSECMNWERNAYEIQCRRLHPENSKEDSKKRHECIRAGICFSCKGRCGGLSGFDNDCEGRSFPF